MPDRPHGKSVSLATFLSQYTKHQLEIRANKDSYWREQLETLQARPEYPLVFSEVTIGTEQGARAAIRSNNLKGTVVIKRLASKDNNEDGRPDIVTFALVMKAELDKAMADQDDDTVSTTDDTDTDTETETEN